MVSTHSRLKAAGGQIWPHASCNAVSTHSRLKAAGFRFCNKRAFERVSTHSRLKAAGPPPEFNYLITKGFNTQPPKGGWWQPAIRQCGGGSFNTQPPKGGWKIADYDLDVEEVSTHSRLKAAGLILKDNLCSNIRFNTQPPKGGWACRLACALSV